MHYIKPLIFTLLSLLLLLQAGGLIQLYKAERIVWQYKMLTATDKEKAVTITVALEENRQNTLSSGHELAFDGKMYDIISTTSTDDSLRILAIPDLEEDEIVERISEAVRNSGKQLPTQLFKLFELCYLPSDMIFLPDHYTNINKSYSSYRNKKLSFLFSEIAYPPEHC